MRIMLYTILLLSLSCTTIINNTKEIVIEDYRYDYIDSALDPILVRFEYEARIRGRKVDRSHLSMTFGLIRTKGMEQTVGYCAPDPKGGLVIKIHTDSWKKYDEYKREELIFHELGHCLIGRDHCDYLKKDNTPISLMYSMMLPDGEYKRNREDLVDELFNTSPKCIGNNGHSDEINGKIRPPTNRHYTR